MIENLREELREGSSNEKAESLKKYFKTGKGEYGEGDIFIGLSVPQIRKIAEGYFELDLEEIKELLDSKIHEERLVSLIILNWKYKASDIKEKKKIIDFYIENLKRVNNWDLVDLSCWILGDYLLENSREVLYELAMSGNIWERRVSIVSTFEFIRRGESEDALKISKILLEDKEDLINKAVGWMLREVGKRCSVEEEEKFLKENYKLIPRVTLRYAIERFPEEKRKKYLRGDI